VTRRDATRSPRGEAVSVARVLALLLGLVLLGGAREWTAPDLGPPRGDSAAGRTGSSLSRVPNPDDPAFLRPAGAGAELLARGEGRPRPPGARAHHGPDGGPAFAAPRGPALRPVRALQTARLRYARALAWAGNGALSSHSTGLPPPRPA
jgi:hypothetical protein